MSAAPKRHRGSAAPPQKDVSPTVRAKWADAEHVEPVFADHVHLSRINDQYYLTFGRLAIPVKNPGAKPPTDLEIKPLARFIVPKDAMQRITKLFQRQVED